MAVIVARRVISLTNAAPILRSPTVAIGNLTSEVELRIKRPTTGGTVSWNANQTIIARIVILIDEVRHGIEGRASGGIRLRLDGTEANEFIIAYQPTSMVGQRALQYLATQTPNARGFYYNVPLTRITEVATTVQAYIELEKVGPGRIDTEISLATTKEAPAPVLGLYHRSVAFDAATVGRENDGDGILTFSHTVSGSDRAVFVGQGWSDGTPPSSTSVTFAGNSLSAILSTVSSSFSRNRPWQLAGASVTTGTQNVVSILSGASGEHTVGIISMTGVDGTTPVGTGVSNTTTTGYPTSLSQTVASVGSNDLVVDFVYQANYEAAGAVAGANQTSPAGAQSTPAVTYGWIVGSYQAGADGGAMEWTGVGGFNGAIIVAVAFKPATAGGAEVNSVPLLMHLRRMRAA